MTKDTFALENIKNMQLLINFMQTKAGAILVIYGFILSILISIFKSMPLKNPINLELFEGVTFSLTYAVGLLVVTIMVFQIRFILVEIIAPKLAGSKEKSLFYFEYISGLEKNEFMKQCEELNSEAEMTAHISSQAYEISKVLRDKTSKVRRAISHLFYTIILLIIFLLLAVFVFYKSQELTPPGS